MDSSQEYDFLRTLVQTLRAERALASKALPPASRCARAKRTAHAPGREAVRRRRHWDSCSAAPRSVSSSTAVADPRQALGHLHLEAVRPAVLVQPALVAEADRLDYQRIAFPMRDLVPVQGLGSGVVGVVRAAVGKHLARHVPRLVAAGITGEAGPAEQDVDGLAFRLDDLAGNAHARHTQGDARVDRVFPVALVLVVRDLVPELRLVERDVVVGFATQAA